MIRTVVGTVQIIVRDCSVDSTLLHVAARRHLMTRYDELVQAYNCLPNQARAADGYHYLPEAYEIFPRYNVVEAILVEVERMDPDRLPELEDVGRLLTRAALTAQSPFTQESGNQVENRAIADERELFHATVLRWLSDGLSDGLTSTVQPLPYRRVLTDAEATERRAALERIWGLIGKSWHPMITRDIPPGSLIVREEAFWDGPGMEHVHAALREAGTRRVTELREYGAEYQLDLAWFAPRYNGAEGVWSDDGLTWIVFASHEGTVAFGGDLAQMLTSTWDDLNDWRWAA